MAHPDGSTRNLYSSPMIFADRHSLDNSWDLSKLNVACHGIAQNFTFSTHWPVYFLWAGEMLRSRNAEPRQYYILSESLEDEGFKQSHSHYSLSLTSK